MRTCPWILPMRPWWPWLRKKGIGQSSLAPQISEGIGSAGACHSEQFQPTDRYRVRRSLEPVTGPISSATAVPQGRSYREEHHHDERIKWRFHESVILVEALRALVLGVNRSEEHTSELQSLRHLV